MADSAAEEKFAEEAPAAPGQAAPALQPESAQPAQNEAAERGAWGKLFALCFGRLVSSYFGSMFPLFVT